MNQTMETCQTPTAEATASQLLGRRPNEGTRPYAAFLAYAEAGPQRSLALVARQLAKSEQLMKRWSSRFDWPARVAAFDNHVANIEREAAESAAVARAVDWAQRQAEHREGEWELRGELVKVAREAIDRWRANQARTGSLEGVARMLELASKLGRLSTGLATDSVEHATEVNVNFRAEVAAAVRKVYGEPVEVEVVADRRQLPNAGS